MDEWGLERLSNLDHTAVSGQSRIWTQRSFSDALLYTDCKELKFGGVGAGGGGVLINKIYFFLPA